jgi:deazaflavin-dependent oxidoreductase (nitroreductase family)
MPEPSRLYRKLIPLTLIPGALDVDKISMRLFDFSLVNRIYSRAAGVGERPCMLMTTLHWKTRLPRTVVLPYHPFGKQYVVIGSLAGRPSDPVWATNVRAHSSTWLRVGGEQLACDAHIAKGEERERLWREISGDGAYMAYQESAYPRVLPVVVHTPIDTRQQRKPAIDRAET